MAIRSYTYSQFTSARSLVPIDGEDFTESIEALALPVAVLVSVGTVGIVTPGLAVALVETANVLSGAELALVDAVVAGHTQQTTVGRLKRTRRRQLARAVSELKAESSLHRSTDGELDNAALNIEESLSSASTPAQIAAIGIDSDAIRAAAVTPGAAPFAPQLIDLTSTASIATIINAPIFIEWSIETTKQSGFLHVTDSDEVIVVDAGMYMLIAQAYMHSDLARCQLEAAIYLDGVRQHRVSNTAYIRNTTGTADHNSCNIHTVMMLSAGTVVQVGVYEMLNDSIGPGNSSGVGNAQLVPNLSHFQIVRLA